MTFSPGPDARAFIWWLLANRDLHGSIDSILANGDVIIRSDLLLQHPNENESFQILYGGVPRKTFEKNQRITFRLKPDWNEPRWKERGGRFQPCVVTSAIKAEKSADDSDIERQIEEVIAASGLVAQANDIVEKAGEQARLLVAEATGEAEAVQKRITAEEDRCNALARDIESRFIELKQSEDLFEERGGNRFIEALTFDRGDVEPPRSRKVPVPVDVVDQLSQAAARSGLSIHPVVLRRSVVGHVVAAFAGQFVLFGGPPGSGKTTLATWLPSVLDMSVSTLAVRPGWLDAADLLGYFDAREDRYIPGPFLDGVLAAGAAARAGACYSVVLDELNIARIENYGADLLSQLEKAHEPGGKGLLHLYSPTIRADVDRRLVEELTADGVDLQAARVRAQRLSELPPDLEIPRGLVVSGTLNNDNTTETLSPKVIDRSFSIRVPANVPEISYRSVSEDVVFSLDLTFAGLDRRQDGVDSDAAHLWSSIRSMVDGLDVLGVHLSNRTARVVSLVPAVARVLSLTEDEVLDDVVAAKVLPWVRFFRGQHRSAEEALDSLRSRLEERGLTDSAGEVAQLLEGSGELVQYLR